MKTPAQFIIPRLVECWPMIQRDFDSRKHVFAEVSPDGADVIYWLRAVLEHVFPDEDFSGPMPSIETPHGLAYCATTCYCGNSLRRIESLERAWKRWLGIGGAGICSECRDKQRAQWRLQNKIRRNCAECGQRLRQPTSRDHLCSSCKRNREQQADPYFRRSRSCVRREEKKRKRKLGAAIALDAIRIGAK